MKKIICISQTFLCCTSICFGQMISIANEKENVITVGLYNPISIAVENIPARLIIAKSDNGEITGKNGIYTLRPLKAGRTKITIFKNTNGKLKKIGEKDFRAKLLWDPVFKIGSGRKVIPKAELIAQEYVRAELENSDFGLKFQIDSFKVCIVPSDTCRYITKLNIGNKISDEINQEFQKLHSNDTIIFKDIYCTGPKGQRKIEPVLIFVSE